MGGGVGGGVETIQVRRESTISSIMSVLYDDNTTTPCVLVIFLSNMSACEINMLKCNIEVCNHSMPINSNGKFFWRYGVRIKQRIFGLGDPNIHTALLISSITQAHSHHLSNFLLKIF